MKIALFGGAFDPPHVGHKAVADSLIEEKIVDEVWFVPVYKHPWAARYGKQQLTDYDIRVKMLELTIHDGVPVDSTTDFLVVEPSVNVSAGLTEDASIAAKQKIAHFKEVSFTYDTLYYFSELHPEHSFCWVMGSEYLSRFDDFLKGHPKLTDFTFYIYPRAGYPLDESMQKPNMIFLREMPEVVASSTEIREKSVQSEPIEGLVVAGVAQLIVEKKLYK